MKLSEIMEGLNILRPHYNEGDGYCIGCEHDQLYAYATDTPLEDTEVARLKELGWFQEDAANEDGAEEAPYDPEAGWSAFV